MVAVQARKCAVPTAGNFHSVAYRGSVEFQRAVWIQQVKTTGKLPYAEAVLKVSNIKPPVKEAILLTNSLVHAKLQMKSEGCVVEINSISKQG